MPVDHLSFEKHIFRHHDLIGTLADPESGIVMNFL